MAKRQLSPSGHGRSGTLRLPKGDLELDGVVDDEGNVEGCPVDVRREAPGEYRVVLLDDSLQPLSD
jgi:hypothetical protein